MTTSRKVDSFPRSAGILLHPTSLPGRYGIGDLDAASRFLDFLVAAKQSVWQMLPTGPTGFADSPYQTFSVFAGNPLLIGIDRLVERGYLTPTEVAATPNFPNDVADYENVIPWKRRLLATAHHGFRERNDAADQVAFADFCSANADWLDDFALFSAIKEERNDRLWMDWPVELVRRDPQSLASARIRLADAIHRTKFEQFEFDRQWTGLRVRCAQAGVQLMGDVPIYVSQDGADTWANPELFKLDADGRPRFVAGVPPDYFSKTGQLWGNPIYDWAAHEREGFAWWIRRFRAVFSRFDSVRIDHFRGFEAFWEVQAGAETAIIGNWRKAPGERLFAALEAALGKLPILAENLGLITPEVERLRKKFGFLGMAVVQFGFGSDEAGSLQFRPENYTEDTVAYSGTHDNDTLIGWLAGSLDATTRTAEEIEAEHARSVLYFGVDGNSLPTRIMESVLQSKARLAILPLQDVLGVDGSGRMNRPSIASGNWRWRFRWDALDAVDPDWLAKLVVATGRDPGPGQEARNRAS